MNRSDARSLVRQRWALFGLVAASFVLGGLSFFRMMDRGIREQASSPSGDRVAVLHNLGEGESPGYGNQLVIRPWWVSVKDVFGEPIFRGYCNGPGTLRWTSETEVELQCPSYEGVELKLETFEGIRIMYR